MRWVCGQWKEVEGELKATRWLAGRCIKRRDSPEEQELKRTLCKGDGRISLGFTSSANAALKGREHLHESGLSPALLHREQVIHLPAVPSLTNLFL